MFTWRVSISRHIKAISRVYMTTRVEISSPVEKSRKMHVNSSICVEKTCRVLLQDPFSKKYTGGKKTVF